MAVIVGEDEAQVQGLAVRHVLERRGRLGTRRRRHRDREQQQGEQALRSTESERRMAIQSMHAGLPLDHRA